MSWATRLSVFSSKLYIKLQGAIITQQEGWTSPFQPSQDSVTYEGKLSGWVALQTSVLIWSYSGMPPVGAVVWLEGISIKRDQKHTVPLWMVNTFNTCGWLEVLICSNSWYGLPVHPSCASAQVLLISHHPTWISGRFSQNAHSMS